MHLKMVYANLCELDFKWDTHYSCIDTKGEESNACLLVKNEERRSETLKHDLVEVVLLYVGMLVANFYAKILLAVRNIKNISSELQRKIYV